MHTGAASSSISSCGWLERYRSGCWHACAEHLRAVWEHSLTCTGLHADTSRGGVVVLATRSKDKEVSGTRARRASVARADPGPFGKTAGLRGQPPIIDGALHAKIRVDDCMWQLQDSHRLIITLQKLIVDTDARKWWPCLIKGEPEINTADCEEGESLNLMVDAGRRLRIQKIELPEAKGKKEKYSPEKAEKAWKDFFTKFPEMHAWEITFKGDQSEKSMEEQLVDTIEKSLGRDLGEWCANTSQLEPNTALKLLTDRSNLLHRHLLRAHREKPTNSTVA